MKVVYCGRLIPDIEFSRYDMKYQLFIHDIFELEPNDKLINYLKKLCDGDNYRLVTEEEINRMGTDVKNGNFKETISRNSFRILESEQENYQ